MKQKKKQKPVHPSKKIGFNIIQYASDLQGCGMYRIVMPSDAMNHYVHYPKFEVRSNWLSKFSFDEQFYAGSTYVVFQRPSTPQQLQMLQWLNSIKEKYGFRVIFEIDDHLFKIPKYNPAHQFYDQYQDTIKKTLGQCDYLTTTTDYLAEVYRPHILKTIVFRNSLPKWLWGDIERRYDDEDFEEMKNRPTICWYASALHFGHNKVGGDFNKDIFNFIVGTRKKYRWIFAGAFPESLKPYKDDIKTYQWRNMLEYPSFMKKMRRKDKFDIGIAFLEDNEFNRGKSNIKQLEYTAVGIPGIYQRLEPYKDCQLRFDGVDELESRIERLRTEPDHYKKVYNKDYEAVKKYLWLEEYTDHRFRTLVNNIKVENLQIKQFKEQEKMHQDQMKLQQAVHGALNKNNPVQFDPLKNY